MGLFNSLLDSRPGAGSKIYAVKGVSCALTSAWAVMDPTPPHRLPAGSPARHPCGRRDVTTVTSRSANRLPASLSAPKLPLRSSGARRSSRSFKAYLDTRTRFPRFSFNNVILIMSQRPDATRVASYATGKELGRQVSRGQRGIKGKRSGTPPPEAECRRTRLAMLVSVQVLSEAGRSDGAAKPWSAASPAATKKSNR
jgi:hypothetical protein